MADKRENAMNTGAPSSLRGIASNGNSIKVTAEQTRNFIGIYKNVYTLQAGEEINLGDLGYALYLLSCPENGYVASYTIGSYAGVQSNNPGKYGDYVNNTSANIVFGRKETNGDFFLKNNREGASTVRIVKISVL